MILPEGVFTERLVYQITAARHKAGCKVDIIVAPNPEEQLFLNNEEMKAFKKGKLPRGRAGCLPINLLTV